jgi:hypothetical protein
MLSNFILISNWFLTNFRFQHALLGAVLQKLLMVRHLHWAPTLHAPGLRHWAAVGGQTGPKRRWKVPVKWIDWCIVYVFPMYLWSIDNVFCMYCIRVTLLSGTVQRNKWYKTFSIANTTVFHHIRLMKYQILLMGVWKQTRMKEWQLSKFLILNI